MVSFLRRKPKTGGGLARAFATAALACAGVVAAVLVPAPPAQAATEIFRTTVQGVLSQLGFPILVNPGTPPAAVDTNGRFCGVITNEYFTVVHGDEGGSFTWQISANFSITQETTGYLSFGNKGGSLRDTRDDNVGLGSPASVFLQATGPGQTLFPIPGRYVTNPGGGVDYSSFVSLSIDGASHNLGFGGTFARRNERINGAMVSEINAVSGVVVRQEIRLRRATARMQWTITNTDTVAHAVGLQFVVNNNIIPFQVDPRRGATSRNILLVGSEIPAAFELTDERADPIYHARHTLRGFDATPPDRLFVTDTRFWLTPRYVLPDPLTYPNPTSRATGVYWDAVSVPPGSSRTIVTYFGNGASSDRLDADFVSAVEATESLRYNADANNNLTDAQKTGATLGTGAAFLTPAPFPVFGSVYNQTLSDPEFEVPLPNVTVSLTPPVGLRFAVVDPATGARDTPAKAMGTIRGDTDAITSWSVEPTGEAYGALVMQMAVSTALGPSFSRTVTRLINVPATPLRVLSNADWQLISFPFAFDPVRTNNSDISTILNTITKPEDLPGGVVPIFRWIPDPPVLNPGTGQYVSAGHYERVTQVAPGVAYYYRPSLNRTVFLNGAVPVAEQAPLASSQGTPFQVGLEQGWNMIGNPYLYDIPVAYLRVVPLENNPSLQSFTFDEAVRAGFLRGALFFFTGQNNDSTSQYDFLVNLTDPLRPWVGYWLFANNRANLVYAPPTPINSAVLGTTPTGLTGSGTATTLGAVATGRALVKNASVNNWKLQLVARNDEGRQDRATFVGVSSQAKDADDLRDLPKPPAPVRDYVYVGIERPGSITRLAQDIKAPGGGAKTWEFEVLTDREGRAVTLTWPNAAALPRRLRLKLTDLDNNKSINLRSASSYRVEAISAEVPRRFRITAEAGTSRALAISGLRAVSIRGAAAGSGRSVSTGYRFDYSLTESATVTGRIRTLTGKMVRTLSAGRAAAIGANALHWDGLGPNGEALPAGPYQVEITARSDSGEIVTERRTILSLR